VDGFQGRRSLQAPSTGIVTTSLATVDVMRRAVKAGANLIITPGRRSIRAPTAPRRQRGAAAAPATAPPPDPVFTAKNEFIRVNRLVVWRFSDLGGWRAPDPFAEGLADALGVGEPAHARRPGLRLTVPASARSRRVAAA
jgi:hypothetical protein